MTLARERKHDAHSVRDTSINSYLNLANMGEMQRIVYDCILENSKKGLFLTDREIASDLNLPDPNNVRPRRFELMEMGIIEEAGKRECSISHKLVLTWKVTNTEPLLKFEGNTATQTRFIESKAWQELFLAMVKRGYKYLGNGKWERERK
jgi:hypothetical protein